MDENIFDLSNFNYTFPRELIAQEPLKAREKARLLVIDRNKKGGFREIVFKDIINFLNKGDILVLNNTKVIKARLSAKRITGAKVEILFLSERKKGLWEVLVKPGKRARVGDVLCFEGGVKGKVIARTVDGTRLIEFSPYRAKFLIETYGQVPLPPYIEKELNEEDLYQTVFAEKEGAVAAPTAGFHFTPSLLEKIKNKGIEIVYVTLHCGLSTFRPVKTQDIRDHPMGEEAFEVSRKTALIINQAKDEKRRIIAVGTTAIRTLESASTVKGNRITLIPQINSTSLYIYPGYKFKIVDALVTNFHTPASTNLILISTFCGKDLIKKAYTYAMEKRFRLFTFGDAMLVI